MSERQRTISEPKSPKTAQPSTAPSLPPARTARRRQRRRGPLKRSDAAFLLLVAGLATFTVLALLNVSNLLQAQARTTTANIPSTTSSASSAPAAPSGIAGNAVVRDAHDVSYAPISLANAGVMYAAVDAHGNIWTGAMEQNKLIRFDPQTGVVTGWTPPHGQDNIMTAAFDTSGNVWFTEQVANYIGRFDPQTQTFKTYPLGKVNGQNAAPQDLILDKQGHVWFTELSGGAIGRLDPATGAIRQWTIPAPKGQKVAYPYCLTRGADGRIWFGYLAGGAVGVLDPTTGNVTISMLSNPQDEVFSMASDGSGNVWFTVLDAPVLGRIDAATGTVTEHSVPSAAGAAPNLYSVTTGPDGTPWFASAGADAIIHYTPTNDTYTFYKLSRAQSIPYGLAFDSAGTLWFSADGTPNYFGSIKP